MMKILFISPLILSALFSSNLRSETEIPLVALIAHPCSYNGNELIVSGFLGFTQPGLPTSSIRLYLNPDDYRYNNTIQSVSVQLSSETIAQRERYHMKYVWLKGIFDCKLIKHGVVGAGGFVSISDLQPLIENPDYKSNDLISGAIISRNANLDELKTIQLTRDAIRKKDLEKTSSYFENPDEILKKLNDKASRLSWVLFNSSFALSSEQNQKFCRSYQYEEDKTRHLYCYSDKTCSSLPKSGEAKDFPDWKQTSGAFCLMTIKINGQLKIDDIQFL